MSHHGGRCLLSQHSCQYTLQTTDGSADAAVCPSDYGYLTFAIALPNAPHNVARYRIVIFSQHCGQCRNICSFPPLLKLKCVTALLNIRCISPKWNQWGRIQSSLSTAIASYRKEISHRIWIHATVGSLHFNAHPRNDSLIPSSITRY